MSSDTVNISIADAEALLTRALARAGASEDSAESTARALVAAEAEGQNGHGFSRLGDYCAQLKSGKVNGNAEPQATWHRDAYVTVDAGYGFAFPAIELAIEEGAKVAKTRGCAAMAITHSHHCGALSVQVEKLAQKGLIGIMMANAPAAMAPWGAKEPIFGTNPIAFAAPRIDGPPLIIDLSLSLVARGKVMNAKKSGKPIPEGWALDKDGMPTTDPLAALDGSMLPAGQAKGTALALMVEVLAATLTGASPSEHVSSFFDAEGKPPDSGQFLLAISPPDETAFLDRIESLLIRVEELEGARLPGARRQSALDAARANGIDVPEHYLALAKELGS